MFSINYQALGMFDRKSFLLLIGVFNTYYQGRFRGGRIVSFSTHYSVADFWRTCYVVLRTVVRAELGRMRVLGTFAQFLERIILAGFYLGLLILAHSHQILFLELKERNLISPPLPFLISLSSWHNTHVYF